MRSARSGRVGLKIVMTVVGDAMHGERQGETDTTTTEDPGVVRKEPRVDRR
jgi:hypothetical protein